MMPKRKPAGSSLGGAFKSPPGGERWQKTDWPLLQEIGRASGNSKRLLLDKLLRLYHRPIRDCFERVISRYSRASGAEAIQLAEDLAQSFVIQLLEDDFLQVLAPGTSFRAFLTEACRRHYINAYHRERVRRPRDGKALLPLQGKDGGETDVPEPGPFADSFDRSLHQAYLEEAFKRVREAQDGRNASHFILVERRALVDGSPGPTYQELAAEFGMSVSDVRNRLHAVRQALAETLWEIAEENRPGGAREELCDLKLWTDIVEPFIRKHGEGRARP